MDNQLTLIVYDQNYRSILQRQRLCDLPAEELPLYRLHQHGVEALSTTELLALLLGTAEAPRLAQELLDRFGSLHQLTEPIKRSCGAFTALAMLRRAVCWPFWSSAVVCSCQQQLKNLALPAQPMGPICCCHE